MAKDTKTDQAILKGGMESPKVSGDFHLFEVSIHSPSNPAPPLELEHELNQNNSPAVDLSEKAIEQVYIKLNNINYKSFEILTSIKKPIINIMAIILIFILFNQFLLPSLYRISHPNTTFPKPLPFTLHSISGSSQILEGDSVVINIFEAYPYNYSLEDINSASNSYESFISPSSFEGNITLHYFGHQN